MFVHLSIHYPRPEHEADLIASMHRFGAAAAGAPGLVHAAVLKDAASGRLIGLMIWTSRAAWQEGVERSRAVVAGDDFDLWEERDPEGFLLDEV
jgi:heme-degrading monooxygenase HmoA